MTNAFKIVSDFEEAVAKYTGAPYCVAVNSCTNALFICLEHYNDIGQWGNSTVEIPKRTYVGVAQSVRSAGFYIKFRDEDWLGYYQLKPFKIFDSARCFTSQMYNKYFREAGSFVCTSHHWAKTLGIQQGGCILHDNADADVWFRKARFDGRTEGVAPHLDMNPVRGWHMYMSPEVAAAGLVRLMHLPRHNEPLPNDNYPDLSQMSIFQ